MDNKRIILHIDMNSYFASVEQQARPVLRGKPIGIVGSLDKKRTIIVAASYEAKALGIKTGTQLWEAKRLCPQIELISADCQRYEAITRQFLNIFISKTPLVEIFSIDEAFLDVTTQTKNFEQAEKLALQIKQEIKETIGASIRCSIGIGSNKFIAKLASEAKKPDGLTIVPPGQEQDFVDQFELKDACGIGFRTDAHLKKLGINSFRDLRARPLTDLTLIFHSYGLKLYRMARGEDFDKIKPYYERELPKSFSRSKTLRRDVFDKNEIKNFIMAFAANIAEELKNKSLLATNVGLYLRFNDFRGYSATINLKKSTNFSLDFFKACSKMLDSIELNKPVRKVGIWIGKLQNDHGQELIFKELSKPVKLEKISEKINQKHGDNLVFRARLAGLNFFGKTPNYGFTPLEIFEDIKKSKE